LQTGVSKTAMAVTEIAKRMECGENSPLFFIETKAASSRRTPHCARSRQADKTRKDRRQSALSALSAFYEPVLPFLSVQGHPAESFANGFSL
jgi:hypothetical protein